MLAEEEIRAFVADGFVAVRAAVPPAITAECRDVVWSEVESRGVRRDDPATWTAHGRFPRMIAQPGVALFGEYALAPRPGAPPPPVEQAILNGLAGAGAGAIK